MNLPEQEGTQSPLYFWDMCVGKHKHRHVCTLARVSTQTHACACLGAGDSVNFLAHNIRSHTWVLSLSKILFCKVFVRMALSPRFFLSLPPSHTHMYISAPHSVR